MDHYDPCIAWAQHLAMRQEDLSPPDRAAHLRYAVAGEVVLAEYQLLDAQLRALSTPMIKPLPRLLRCDPGARLGRMSPNTKEGVMSVSKKKPLTLASDDSIPAVVPLEQEEFRQHSAALR